MESINMEFKRELIERYSNLFCQEPSLAGIRIYPVVSSGNFEVINGGITPDGSIFKSLEEAAFYAATQLIEDNIDRLESEIKNLVKKAENVKIARREKNERDRYEREIASLFNAIVQQSEDFDSAILTLDFYKMNEKRGGEPIEFGFVNCYDEIVKRIAEYFNK